MGRLRIIKSPGGIYLLVPYYYAGIGTRTDQSTGRIYCDQFPGRRTIYVNAGGSDAADGLTPSTPRLTQNGGVAALASGYTPGDRILFAGTGGRSYADDGSTSGITFLDGISRKYPLPIQSYDPATPLDETKYGWLLGADMPKMYINTSGTTALSNFGNSGTNNLFIQGLEFDGQSVDGAHIDWNGLHNGFAIQHCKFNTVRPDFGDGTDWLLSHVSTWGQWTTGGNSQGILCAHITNGHIQDCFFAHNGWKLNVSRDVGQASIFGHGSYLAASPQGQMYVERVMYVDPAADGPNLRTNVDARCIASIDGPLAMIMGGWSGSYLEDPLGSLVRVYDYVATGGADIATGIPRSGISVTNAREGSIIKNAACFDNSFGVGDLVALNQDTPEALDCYMRMENVRAKGFHTTQNAAYAGTTYPARCHLTAINCILDVLYPNTGGSSGNSAWTTGTFPNALTKAQAIAAMGLGDGSKNALVNTGIEYPHLAGQLASAFVTIGLQSLGLQPITFAATAPPSISGLTAPRTTPGY